MAYETFRSQYFHGGFNKQQILPRNIQMLHGFQETRPWCEGEGRRCMEYWEVRSQIRSHKFDHTQLQIHTVDHTLTANPCDWLQCRRVALLLVGCPHSLVYLHLPVVEGLIFCISATPHLGTSLQLILLPIIPWF